MKFCNATAEGPCPSLKYMQHDISLLILKADLKYQAFFGGIALARINVQKDHLCFDTF